LNVPFVRLALAVGLPRLASFLEEVGAPVTGRPWPSLALGAHGMTPLEVARAYSSLSAEHDAGGVVWMETVTGNAGEPLWQVARLQRKTAAPRARAMVRSMMAEAARTGTARAVSNAFPGHGALAAKTGTTDDRRDSWFAAFGADLLGVVWVGHDDNRPTGLTGAMGALPVWLDVFAHRPPRPLPTQPPAGLAWTSIDARTGRQVAASCPGALRVLLPVERVVPSAGVSCR
jgi:penicillin-binding protein 1B